jgi:hypothetical protein
VSRRPHVSASERLPQHVERLAKDQVVLEHISERLEALMRLTKALASHHADGLDALRADIGVLPAKRGRRLEEIPPNFRQEVLRLKTENGWGRPRIREFMQAKDWMVRRVLEEAAGDEAGSRHRGS